MTPPPEPTRIYHITHVDNLPSILGDGGLWSDSTMVERDGPTTSIGMEAIKSVRLRTPMPGYPDDMVGEYVPFNFCPRSIMLSVFYYGNRPGLTYLGGQGPILHLEADLRRTVAWAEGEGRRWAFTLGNARARLSGFRTSLDRLDDVDWVAVAAHDFRDAQIKESKQAELLVHEFFSWELVERVGVLTPDVQARAQAALGAAAHRPPVDVMPAWYFPIREMP